MKKVDVPFLVMCFFAVALFVIAGVKDSQLTNWKTATANTLRCGEKGAEVVERPIAEGLVTTAKFIVCKK
jgi:hypothetical protein